MAPGERAISCAQEGGSGLSRMSTFDVRRWKLIERYCARSISNLCMIILSRGEEPLVVGGISTVTVSVDDVDAALQLGVDESHSLDVQYSSQIQQYTIAISSKTVYGAYHALESLAQMVRYTPTENQYYIPVPVSIQDAPRFRHRGLMIDTSRHFLPVPSICRIVDSMPTSKLNVMH
eukprot:gene22175-1301_t